MTVHNFSDLRKALIANGTIKPKERMIYLRPSTSDWVRTERERRIRLGFIIPANVERR